MVMKCPAWFRHGCFAVSAIVLLGANPGWAMTQQAPARPTPNENAYAAAMKCFVANGRATGMRQRAGDAAGAARYEASGRSSFDAAMQLGRRLGYPNHRMNQDFDLVQLRELPLMVSDAAYFREAVTMCRSLGLMPAS